MTRKILIEVCVDSVEGCLAAGEGGADRAELCSGLAEGGITPSAATIAVACERSRIPVVVLVRPRRGDFLYSPTEIEVIAHDVQACKAAGAAGVAIGLLRPDGTVDAELMQQLVLLARPLTVTFHRAFDFVRDQDEALDELVQLGVDRVLTSGGEANAEAGLENIARLVQRAAGRIVVVPGGGVREHNIRALIDGTGASEVHFSARAARESGMEHRNPRCALSADPALDEYEVHITDAEQVRRTIAALKHA